MSICSFYMWYYLFRPLLKAFVFYDTHFYVIEDIILCILCVGSSLLCSTFDLLALSLPFYKFKFTKQSTRKCFSKSIMILNVLPFCYLNCKLWWLFIPQYTPASNHNVIQCIIQTNHFAPNQRLIIATYSSRAVNKAV